jgi:hypothetical protein
MRPEDFSPRSSTPESDSSGPSPRSLTPSEQDVHSENEHTHEDEESIRSPESHITDLHDETVEHGDFELEEVRESDKDMDDSEAEELEVLRPDHYEDADSVVLKTPSRPPHISSHLDSSVVNGLRDLDCSDERASHTEDGEIAEMEEFLKRRRKDKRKKWNAVTLKRRIENIGSASDAEDRDVRKGDAMEITDRGGHGARRLRRKVGERSSQILEGSSAKATEESASCVEIDDAASYGLPLDLNSRAGAVDEMEVDNVE